MKENGTKYIILYNERHGSYGLFNDLKSYDNVRLVEVGFRYIRSSLIKCLRKLHLSKNIADYVRLPLKKKWYRSVNIEIEENVENYLIVFDLALACVPISVIKKAINKPNVKSVLIMINAVASSDIRHSKREIESIGWDEIYTFDRGDAQKYGYKYLGCCYYSKYDEEKLNEVSTSDKRSDIYYIGTLLNCRKQLTLSVYEWLRQNELSIEFHLFKSGIERYETFPYADEIDYYTSNRGLIPYKDILASIIKSNVILEIVQYHQSGPTLRYFEAVCYNKKLLTNNPYIHTFPLYDERYMKVFQNVEDIDIKWICEVIDVDYHYNNEFSPVHLLEKITEYTD